eukprot:3902012-Rhodomonas_salina.2
MRPESPSLSLTGTSRLDRTANKVDKKIFKEVVKDCEALSDLLAGTLGNLALQSFSQKQQGNKEPYDALLEEFKWLQSLPSQSVKVIEDILPPGASGTNDKFRSDSMVRTPIRALFQLGSGFTHACVCVFWAQV